MRISFLALMGVLACDDSVVEVGVIETSADPARIDLPDSVRRGEAALVRVTTYGTRCMSKEGTDLVTSEDGAEITPYDRREPGGCVLVLVTFGHETYVSFDTLGPKTIRVNGRRSYDDELIQLSFSMMVVE